MLSDDLIHVAACALASACHTAGTAEEHRRLLRGLAITLEAAADRAAAMEACYQGAIDDAVTAAAAPNVVAFPLRRTGSGRCE